MTYDQSWLTWSSDKTTGNYYVSYSLLRAQHMCYNYTLLPREQSSAHHGIGLRFSFFLVRRTISFVRKWTTNRTKKKLLHNMGEKNPIFFLLFLKSCIIKPTLCAILLHHPLSVRRVDGGWVEGGGAPYSSYGTPSSVQNLNMNRLKQFHHGNGE